MARPKVIIADEDAGYIVPLQFKFVTDFFNKIDMEIITDRSYFEEFFSKPQNAEILIVSDELYDSSLQRHNIQNIFVMMEQYDEGGTGELNVNQLYKYTSVKEIFNEIVGKSAGALNVAEIEKKETQIVLVTSAAGGVGKTTVAMGIAACLEQNYKRVLYINASRLQSFQNMLTNNTSLTTPEIYSKLICPQDNIYQEIKHVIRKESFSYLPAFKASLLSIGLDYSVYKNIILSAKGSDEYDYIVVDTENTFDENYTDLLDLADRVIFITKQTVQSVYATNLLVANVNGIKSDKYAFICNDFNSEEENALIRSEMKINFSIENYIEHRAGMDRQKVSEYAKVQGIQKTALLVM